MWVRAVLSIFMTNASSIDQDAFEYHICTICNICILCKCTHLLHVLHICCIVCIEHLQHYLVAVHLLSDSDLDNNSIDPPLNNDQFKQLEGLLMKSTKWCEQWTLILGRTPILSQYSKLAMWQRVKKSFTKFTEVKGTSYHVVYGRVMNISHIKNK
jgi:hypothetical protein